MTDIVRGAAWFLFTAFFLAFTVFVWWLTATSSGLVAFALGVLGVLYLLWDVVILWYLGDRMGAA